MKNDQERCAYSKANPYTAPKPPMAPRLRLIILGHGATLLPVCLRAKRKRDRAAVAGVGDPGWVNWLPRHLAWQQLGKVGRAVLCAPRADDGAHPFDFAPALVNFGAASRAGCDAAYQIKTLRVIPRSRDYLTTDCISTRLVH